VEELAAVTIVSDLDLEAIEKACAEAAPGPWKWCEGREMRSPVLDAEREAILSREDWFRNDGLCARMKELAEIKSPIIETDGGCYGPGDADAAFIANARSWVPALVARVRELQEQLRQAEVREVDWAARVLSEREACARVAETYDSPAPFSGQTIAQVIRARTEVKG
jgi:hypothetical protein